MSEVSDAEARARFYADIRAAMQEGLVFNAASLSKVYGLAEASSSHLFREFQKRRDGEWVKARKQYMENQRAKQAQEK